MVADVGNILEAGQRARLLALQKTARQLDVASARLASGQKVSSVLDNPNSYFLARSLRDRAGDLDRLLDGIGQSIMTMQEADHGVTAQLKILDLAESFLEDAIKQYYAGELQPGGLAANETLVPFTNAANLTTYIAGQDMPATGPITVANGDTVTFDGNFWKQLAFNYNVTPETVMTFQYKNNIQPDMDVIGFDNDTNYTNDAHRFFIDGTQTTGVTFAAPSGAYQYTGNGAYQEIEIPVGTYFTGSFNRMTFIHDDDVLPYAVSSFSRIILREGAKIESLGDLTPFQKEYEHIVAQLDDVAKDANYRGINLLHGDNLKTIFNETGSSKLVTEGIDATFKGLGLNVKDFSSIDAVEAKIVQIHEARETLRHYATHLSNDLNIIQVRQNFTRDTINIHKKGADDLTNVDLNEAGAEYLALQTRQQLEVAMLSFRVGNVLSILS